MARSHEILSMVPLRERVGKAPASEIQVFISHLTPVVRNYPVKLRGEVREETLQTLISMKAHFEG